MDLLAPVKAFDRLQRRRRGLAVPVAVIKKFGDDQGGNLAALIAYYGFFSLFPLLLVLVTGLGYVLEGNPDAQREVLDSALKDIPLVGQQVEAGGLEGNLVALIVGVVGAVLAGLGVTLALQTAIDRVYAVPHRERADVLFSRLRGLRLLVVVGTIQVASTTIAGLVIGGLGGVLVTVGGLVASLALNLLLFSVAFRLLVNNDVPWRQLVPGIVFAAIAWALLQALGGSYINGVVRGASDTYGTFATVIGLLTWLFLGARIVVYAAELNVVLARGLWPRGLFEPLEAADKRALRALAEIETRVDEQRVSVAFDDKPST